MAYEALKRSVRQGALKQSFTWGDRNGTGYIGEEIFLKLRNGAKRINNFDYDFEVNGKKVDVKTAITNYEPKGNFDFNIRQTKQNQEVDYFVFVYVHTSLEHGWVVGYLSKEEFLEKAQFIKAGDNMPQGGKYLTDGRKILVNQMRPF